MNTETRACTETGLLYIVVVMGETDHFNESNFSSEPEQGTSSHDPSGSSTESSNDEVMHEIRDLVSCSLIELNRLVQSSVGEQ